MCNHFIYSPKASDFSPYRWRFVVSLVPVGGNDELLLVIIVSLGVMMISSLARRSDRDTFSRNHGKSLFQIAFNLSIEKDDLSSLLYLESTAVAEY